MRCQVEGGWAHCLQRFISLQLLGHGGLSAGGVVVMLGGQPRTIFARLAAILADGEGHMKAFGWKGAGSLRPCMRHYNVYMKAEMEVLYAIFSSL